jgi:hypothetical protein
MHLPPYGEEQDAHPATCETCFAVAAILSSGTADAAQVVPREVCHNTCRLQRDRRHSRKAGADFFCSYPPKERDRANIGF